jgi:hypothetical protein
MTTERCPTCGALPPRNADKAYEARVRKRAARSLLLLARCRSHNPAAPGYGTYRLSGMIDGRTVASAGPSGYGLTLPDAEVILTAIERGEAPPPRP